MGRLGLRSKQAATALQRWPATARRLSCASMTYLVILGLEGKGEKVQGLGWGVFGLGIFS